MIAIYIANEMCHCTSWYGDVYTTDDGAHDIPSL